MEYKNEIDLYGEISRELEYSHEYNGVPFYSVDLKLNNAKNNKNGLPVVRCYFRGDQLTSDDIHTGTLIHLTGKLVNSKVKGIIDISVLIDKYNVIEEITNEMENICVLSGVVTKIFTNKENYRGFTNFVIAELDDEGKKLFSSRVIFWNRLGEYIYKNLHVNDFVLINGLLNNSTTKSKPESEDEESEEVLVSEVLGTFFTKLSANNTSEESVDSNESNEDEVSE